MSTADNPEESLQDSLTAIDLNNWPQVEPPIAADEEVESFVTSLIDKMTLAQKVGQVIQADIASITPEDIREYPLGSILNGGNSAPGGKQYASANEWLALADAFYDVSVKNDGDGVSIPIIWGSDAVHGHSNVIGATVFPHNIALGATRNPDLIREIGRATAREMRVTGIGWTFAPTIAVARDDRWGRTYESYSENPQLVSEYAKAMFKGLQGDVEDARFLRGENVIATAKHFLADGGTYGGKDQGDVKVGEKELVRIHAAPYVSAIESGSHVVMASFSSWQGKKVHGHRGLLTDVLKNRMGFSGFVVGDWNAHGQLPGCTEGNCAAAINAGLDMYMAPDSWRELFENTLRQVESGEIPMARLHDAVRRILRVKVLAGVFDEGRPSSRPLAGDYAVLASAEHLAIARRAVRESLVLLKNQNRVLPLQPDMTVLVTGDAADNLEKQTGGWTLTWQGSGVNEGDYRNIESIYDGIAARVAAAGGHVELSPDGTFSQKPDVAIVVFGEEPYAEFQGDRDHLSFGKADAAHMTVMQHLRANSIPIIAVFLSGRPMWVNPEINASDAFVAAWLPGSAGGGVADVLFGDAEFSGKLPFSWPGSAMATPNIGDTDDEPLFPYGYGLTIDSTAPFAALPEDSGLAVGQSDGADVLFGSGAFSKPWRLVLNDGDESAGGTVVASVIDGRAQEDSRQLVWSRDGTGSASIERPESIDWTRESNDAVAIELDVRVDLPPSSKVLFSIRCGQNCEGAVDVTDVLREATSTQFSTVSVPLQCFESAGADMSSIYSGFVVTTDGTLTLTIASVKLSSSSMGRLDCP